NRAAQRITLSIAVWSTRPDTWMTGGFSENLSLPLRPGTFGHRQWPTGGAVGSLQHAPGAPRKQVVPPRPTRHDAQRRHERIRNRVTDDAGTDTEPPNAEHRKPTGRDVGAS